MPRQSLVTRFPVLAVAAIAAGLAIEGHAIIGDWLVGQAVTDIGVYAAIELALALLLLAFGYFAGRKPPPPSSWIGFAAALAAAAVILRHMPASGLVFDLDRFDIPLASALLIVAGAAAVASRLGAVLQAIACLKRLIAVYKAEIAVAVASLVIGALLAEAGLRLVFADNLFSTENFVARRASLLRVFNNNTYHPEIGWVLTENLSTPPETTGANQFATGQYGIRMNRHEITPLRKGGVLAVGDSFTAGSEVGDGETWPAYLEQRLGIPVLNAAAGGWASDQIVLRAESLIEPLAPTAIVVSFLSEDIVRASYRVFSGGSKPYFTVENGRLTAHNIPVEPFAGRSDEIGRLRGLLGHSILIAKAMEAIGRSDWWYKSTSSIRVDNDYAAVSCLLLERLKRRADAAGIRMYFLLQYGGSQVLLWEDEPPYAKRVIQCVEAASIPYVNTWGPLRAVSRRDVKELESLYNMFDKGTVYGHMSPKGNAFIADLVAEMMRR